jgi:hypothetical protein
MRIRSEVKTDYCCNHRSNDGEFSRMESNGPKAYDMQGVRGSNPPTSRHPYLHERCLEIDMEVRHKCRIDSTWELRSL